MLTMLVQAQTRNQSHLPLDLMVKPSNPNSTLIIQKRFGGNYGTLTGHMMSTTATLMSQSILLTQ